MVFDGCGDDEEADACAFGFGGVEGETFEEGVVEAWAAAFGGDLLR